MAIYALSDLHLAISSPEKTMEVFGSGWNDYMNRIKENCEAVLRSEDTLLMPGDLSWVMYLKDGYEDFKFINDLPGSKIIGRGNHDYYWTTVKKLREYFDANGFDTLEIVRNNCIRVEDSLITGTRGWMFPWDEGFSAEDRKILDREIIRIGLCAKALSSEDPDHTLRHILMLHYPPLSKDRTDTEITKVIEGYNIDLCIYGHLHGRAHLKVFEGQKDGTGCDYRCVSADFLGFKPLKIGRFGK